MTGFWEESFVDKQEMWGLEPAQSAILANDFFKLKAVKTVLIPGIGYGRHAKLFQDNGMEVVGIEISKTAIALSRKHYGDTITIYEGSVTEMPYDNQKYDAIFCYGLIHLLDEDERRNLIMNCYNQLADGGHMIFTAITKDAQTYGKGTKVGKDRFEMFGGVNMFFYDEETIQQEFGSAGLIDVTIVKENFPFYFITCTRMTTISI